MRLFALTLIGNLFLKSCAVTLMNQPLGLFRCRVSSEETESYALPYQPSTPNPQFISTNSQNSCFTTFFNSNQFQNHRRTAPKRPVTTIPTKQNPAKKVCTKPKLETIHHKAHRTPCTKPAFSPNRHHQISLITQNPFKSPNITKNRTTYNKAAC